MSLIFYEHPMDKVFNTGFRHFTTTCGIDGMAKVTGKRLDLLAVIAMLPGKGFWKTFWNNITEEFEVIVLHVLLNSEFAAKLVRDYGFRYAAEFNEVDNRMERVVIWEKINATP